MELLSIGVEIGTEVELETCWVAEPGKLLGRKESIIWDWRGDFEFEAVVSVRLSFLERGEVEEVVVEVS